MKFKGWQKVSLVDYPGKIVTTAFVGGCNFRCLYCHNRELVENGKGLENIHGAAVLAWLEKRSSMVDGVCISGGEPALCGGLRDFARSVKSLGKEVKLDTNGTNPSAIAALIEEGLVDYIAMDIKCALGRYRELTGCSEEDLSGVEASIGIIRESGLDHEFRTTLTREFNPVGDAEFLADLAAGGRRYVLQKFRMPEHPFRENLHPVERQDAEAIRKAIAPFVGETILRGY